ncbi:MAG: aminotransferase class III-fold pyridoxal phosphate-dependent enzyme [Steroidobacteraceae bacterium]|jgi:acetylornithine/succinyldiaminopimelate/putrescine aminotransferase|nr:aminotransferase class III-fold pyridoxal phosphate-dependent enzyme [Steroidobacteraceae bacterium]
MNAYSQASALPPAVRSNLAQVFAQYPLEVTRADGVWLHTRDGRRVLDFYGGHAVAALGYGHPRWIESLEQQARSVLFQTNAIPMEIRERAASRLVKFAGLGLDSVFFVNSGAEANENALRLAFKQSGRPEAVALEHGWHGRTAAAGAVTWGAREKWYGFPQLPFDVKWVSRTDPAAAAAGITERTACVIVEPVQGLAGAFDVPVPVLQAIRRRCDEVGALLIYDEVQCGVGRTGWPFAANMTGVTPDVITTAKALGAGFPVSAMLLAPKVAAKLKVEDMGTTFGGGPMACAIVEVVLDIIESEGLLENVRRMSKLIRESCTVGPVTGSQGAGFLLGLRTTRPAKEVQKELMARDVFCGTAADPHVLRLLPPYTLREEHVAKLRDALAEIPA